MIIHKTTNLKQINSIITRHVLWTLHGHTEDPEEYEIPQDGTEWLVAYEDDVTIGLMEIKAFTRITCNAHIHILPEFHKTGKSLEVIDATRQYLKEHTEYINAITTVPIRCEHVIKLMEKAGFVVQGLIKDGIVYNNILQDLILYQLKV